MKKTHSREERKEEEKWARGVKSKNCKERKRKGDRQINEVGKERGGTDRQR